MSKLILAIRSVIYLVYDFVLINWCHINQNEGERDNKRNLSFNHPGRLINSHMDDLHVESQHISLKSIFPHAQPSPSVKFKCTSSHLGQKRLCKPNKGTSPWEINSHGPFLCNLFLSPERMSLFPDHLLLSSRKLESLKLLKEICHLHLERKNVIYLNLQLLK